jgi:ankyrin repeat protein
VGIVALAAYGYWEGTPQDIVNAVRRNDVAAVTAALARDSALVHTKVYPQAFERTSQRQAYAVTFGGSPWGGRYLIHDAVRLVDAVPMLEALTAAGADLSVRLHGATLLHLAARAGDVEVATWLLGRGADVHAVNDCEGNCEQRGQTPLHDAQVFREEMSELLLARGARVDALSANGRSPLHEAGDLGQLSAAFLLCRHGADPARKDASGKTPYDLARSPSLPRDRDNVRPEDEAQLVQWLKPGGGCANVAAAARSTGAPVADDEARKVYAQTVSVNR